MNEGIEDFSKTELLKNIRLEHQRLDEVLVRLTASQMLIPGVDGEWSVKDALAHISAWEQRMLNWIASHLRGESPNIPLPWDVERMNAETYTLVRNKPLAQVQDEFRQSYQQSLVLIESISKDQLQVIYTDTWPMGAIWTGIASNTCWHYKEHRTNIENWLNKQQTT